MSHPLTPTPIWTIDDLGILRSRRTKIWRLALALSHSPFSSRVSPGSLLARPYRELPPRPSCSLSATPSALLPLLLTRKHTPAATESSVRCHNITYSTASVLRSAQPLVPLSSTSGQLEYKMVYRKHIHYLDNDSLLQVFSCYRLEDEDNWYFQLTWRKLVQVCRRWRYLIYNSCSYLDLCLLLTNDSPSIPAPSHLPLLPLIIYQSDRTRTMVRKDEDNIHLGLLQHHGRVRQVILQAPSLSLSMWVEPMNKAFPRLKVLSLLSTTIKETNLMLPETLQAPDLCSLVLHGIGLPSGLTLLSSSTTLSTISLTHIGASCYFTPGQLITKLQSLPHLKELSIGFAIPIPLPSSEGTLLPAPIPPVTLPTLRKLTFQGVDIYLDNLVAQINSPLLERLSLTLFFDITFTLANLTEFIHRTEGLRCLFSQVVFNKDGASIETGSEQGIGKLSLHVSCESLDWQIDSATQVCSTLGKILSTVKELTVDLNTDKMISGWENTLDSTMWHELLLPFISVKKLRIGTSLTLELSQALGSAVGVLVQELLPKLQEVEVQLVIDPVKNALSLFLGSRESVGRPVHLLVRHGSKPRSRMRSSGFSAPTWSANKPNTPIPTTLPYHGHAMPPSIVPPGPPRKFPIYVMVLPIDKLTTYPG